MKELKHTAFFTGIMDNDSDPRAIKQGNYQRIYNGFNGTTTNSGTVTNIPSNVAVTFQLPLGFNKCIGAFEDLGKTTVIFCNYNDGGFHGVYRWFKNKEGYVNGVIEKIYEVKTPNVYTPFNPNPLNFQLNPEFRITGLFLADNYFFFTDNFNRSKMIDLERGNDTNKRKKINLYFNRANFGVITNYSLAFFITGNPVPLILINWVSQGSDYQSQTNDFLNAYKLSPASDYFSVSACNEFPTITANSEGDYYVTAGATSGFAPAAVPVNFYPDSPPYDPFSLALIDRGVYVPKCEPDIIYQTDNTIQTNFVRNKVYQARVRYKYFDNSYSVYSAISVIPIPIRQCDPNNYGNTGNYLLIDFTDERLTNPALASVIKNVEIAILEPVLGAAWVTIKTLDPFEVVGTNMQNFKWYNQETTELIPVLETDKPFDSLFIKHKSEEIVDDRAFTAGGLEGYNTPCIDAEIDINYEQPVAISARYSVSGNIPIQNVYYSGNHNPYQQQILYKNGSSGQILWGGFKESVLPNFGAFPGDSAAYLQTCPLAGFTVYLAGTPYYAVTRQGDTLFRNLCTGLGIALDPDGIVIISSLADNVKLFSLLNYYFDNQLVIPQLYTINNVPNGRYVLRVASHLLTANELGDITKNWQKTSTNIGQYNTAGQLVPNYELEIVVNNANVTGQDMVVIDLCDPNEEVTALMGYTVANETGVAAPTTISEYLSQTRVELSARQVTGGAPPPIFQSSLVNPIADHNGYTWSLAINVSGVSYGLIGSSVFTANYSSAINLISGAAWTSVSTPIGQLGAFYVNNVNFHDNARTQIQGQVVDSSGDGVSGVVVVNTHGQWENTDQDGFFSITTYAPQSNGSQPVTRTDALILSSSGALCQFLFQPDRIPYSIPIGQNDYNFSNTYSVANVIVTIVSLFQSISKWKRGSDRYFGIVYYDELDRKCAVGIINQAVHITFFTERDSNGVLNPPGAANITASIFNEPPDWAVKWQMVALKNQQSESFLDWVANKVEYVDANNVVTTTNPIKVRINIDNIGYYTTKQYPNAVINYTFQKGDRLRFITRDANSGILTTLYDYEVIAADDSYIYIPVDNTITWAAGASFEVYTPRGQDQTKIFYEFGQCYEVKSAVINGVLKKYHEGNIQNQTYGTLPNLIVTPAIITTTWGDVYYRLRNVPYNYDPAQPTLVPQFKLVNIQDESVSDFYSSRANGWGRPNTDAITQGQVDRISTVRFSNRYISGTLINGLRNFEALNEKQFATTYGRINKLVLINKTVLKAIFSNSFMVSMYINQNIIKSITQGNTEQLLSLTKDVIPQTHDMQRNYGTQNPESICYSDDGKLFGWDGNYSVIWMQQGDGIVAISSVLMNTTFNKIGKERADLANYNSEVTAVYDKQNDLYIVSFLPMIPKPEIKSKVLITVPNIEALTTTTQLKLYIKPLNILLVDTILNTDPDYPNTANIIVREVNNYGNGWSAAIDKFGNAEISAPGGGSLYQNQVAVLTYLNPVQKDFTFIFIDGTPAATGTPYVGETLVYSKGKQGWIQNYPFKPENYCALQSDYVSFKDGNLWLHGDTSQYNNFYGVPYVRTVKYVCNVDIEKVKDFIRIDLTTNSPPFCPNLTVPFTDQNPTGMDTEITKPMFDQVLGKFWAKIPKDKLTPPEMLNPPTIDEAWVNGRDMQGDVLIVSISNDSNNLAPLLKSVIGYFYKELS